MGKHVQLVMFSLSLLILMAADGCGSCANEQQAQAPFQPEAQSVPATEKSPAYDYAKIALEGSKAPVGLTARALSNWMIPKPAAILGTAQRHEYLQPTLDWVLAYLLTPGDNLTGGALLAGATAISLANGTNPSTFVSVGLSKLQGALKEKLRPNVPDFVPKSFHNAAVHSVAPVLEFATFAAYYLATGKSDHQLFRAIGKKSVYAAVDGIEASLEDTVRATHGDSKWLTPATHLFTATVLAGLCYNLPAGKAVWNTTSEILTEMAAYHAANAVYASLNTTDLKGTPLMPLLQGGLALASSTPWAWPLIQKLPIRNPGDAAVGFWLAGYLPAVEALMSVPGAIYQRWAGAQI